MPQFIIEREFPGASRLPEAEIRDGSLKSLEVLGQLGSGIQWLHSFVTDDKIYCNYYAPDESLIRARTFNGLSNFAGGGCTQTIGTV